MGAIYFPLLRSNFQKKIAPEQIYIEADGEKVNLTQMLSRKVNIYQGDVNKNKILITDQHGNVTVINGVVMQQSERDALKKLNPGTATDLDGDQINVRFDPTSFGIDNENRLILKDPAHTSHTHEIKDVNQLREELDDRILIYQPEHPGKMLVVDPNTNRITFIEIPKGVEISQYQQDGIHIATINDTKIYAPNYQFTTDEHDDIITHEDRITSLENKVNAFFDIDVKNWTEFLAAVEVSRQFSVRIHFRADITVTSTKTIDLSNCLIYGHYFKWIVNSHTTTLRGNFGWFDNVWFEGSKNYPLFNLQGENSKSCTFYFMYCRIYRWTDSGDAVFINVNGGSGTSVHTTMNMCVINDENFQSHDATLLWKHTSGVCMSLKIAELLYSGHNTEVRKVGFTGSNSTYDMFVADGSCVYKQVSGGYTPARFYQWGTISIVRQLTSGTPIATLNGTQIYAPDLAYSIEEVATTEGFYKTYRIAKTDASGGKSYISGKIDITKDLFLQSVERVTITAQNAVQDLPHGDYFHFVFNVAEGENKDQYIPIDTLRAEMTAGRHITIDGTEVSATGFIPQYADLDDALPDENIVQYIGEPGGGYTQGYFYKRNPNTWESEKWIQTDVQPRKPEAHTHQITEVLHGDNGLDIATEQEILDLTDPIVPTDPTDPTDPLALSYATKVDILTLFTNDNLDENLDDTNATIADDNDINGIFGG